MAIAQRVLNDIDSLKRLGEEPSSREGGSLTIATTHTQARYVPPQVIERFIRQHPKVQLHLRQGNPTQICEMVEAGVADLAVGTETTRAFPTLVRMDCFELERSIHQGGSSAAQDPQAHPARRGDLSDHHARPGFQRAMESDRRQPPCSNPA
ncbi:MAG: LysR substrate-binding domain-containing protein [Pigmentiphaga sp.]|uniref:LysR substrate-binding domain-containing protein n=1 Tax=unclassified Pigmentiphaga TaxID=2626614 RepID=UPI0030D36238